MSEDDKPITGAEAISMLAQFGIEGGFSTLSSVIEGSSGEFLLVEYSCIQFDSLEEAKAAAKFKPDENEVPHGTTIQ